MPEEIPKDPVDRMNEVLIALKIPLPDKNYAPEVYYTGFLDALNRSNNTDVDVKKFQAYLQPNKNALNKVRGTKDLEKFNQFMNAVDSTKTDLEVALQDPEKVVKAANLKNAQAAQSQPPAAEEKGMFTSFMKIFNMIFNLISSIFNKYRKVSSEENSNFGNVTPSDGASVSAESFKGSTKKERSNNPADQAIQKINEANNLDAAIKAFDEYAVGKENFDPKEIVWWNNKIYTQLESADKLEYIENQVNNSRATVVARHDDISPNDISQKNALPEQKKTLVEGIKQIEQGLDNENKSEQNFSN